MFIRSPRLRDSGGLAVTIALHAAVILAALFASGVVTAPPAAPPLITRPIPDPPRPADPAPAAPAPRDIAIPVDVLIPDVVIAPDPDTPRVPVTPATPTGPGPSGPVIDEPGTPAVGPVVIAPTRATLDQRFAAAFQPPYPAASRRLDETGVVLVRVRIGVDGRVLAASVARSSGHRRLDEAAVARALSSWRFIPATADGRPVEAERDIPVRFELAAG